jgi:hypothetical protein
LLCRHLDDKVSIANLDVCDKENENMIKQYLSTSTAQAIWYHNGTPYTIECFSADLYFHHSDFRKYEPYSRVSNEKYLSDAIEAFATGKTKNGTKKPWIFANVPYIRIEESVCFDPFHVFENIIDYTISRLKNERKINYSTRLFCRKTHSHPSLWLTEALGQGQDQGQQSKQDKRSKKKTASKSGSASTTIATSSSGSNPLPKTTSSNSISSTIFQAGSAVIDQHANNNVPNSFGTNNDLLTAPIWVLGSVRNNLFPTKGDIEAAINGVELYLQAVCIPPLYKTDFRIYDYLSNFSHYYGVQRINGLISAMDFITYAINEVDKSYPVVYLIYYSMLSSLASSLSSPVINPDEIDILYKRSVEVVAVHSGLFPPSEVHHIYHQLVDLAPFIKIAGPLRCTSTLPIERHMTALKNNIILGGTSFYKPATYKEMAHELHELTMNFKTNCSPFEHQSERYKKGSTGEVYYSDYHCRLKNKDNVTGSLSTYEQRQLLDFLVEEIKRLEPNYNSRLANSSLFRLYECFQKCVSLKIETTIFIFRDWMYRFELFYRDQYEAYKIIKDCCMKIRGDNDAPILRESDFETIPVIFSQFQALTIYRTATIWGTEFQSRGQNYAESKKRNKRKINNVYGSEKVFSASNSLNELAFQYHDQNGVKTWCKLYIENAATSYKICGQLNYFFVLKLSHDYILDGLPIANVTQRKANLVRRRKTNHGDMGFTFYENLYEVDCQDNISMIFDELFIALYNIYSCPMAMVALNMNREPIQPISKYRAASNCTKETAHKLLLYALKRERESLHGPDLVSKIYPYHNKDTLVRIKQDLIFDY